MDAVHVVHVLFHTNRVHGADMKSMPSIPPRRLRSKFGRVEGCYMLHRLGMLQSDMR